MRVYLAGPISGYDLQERVETFKETAEVLRAAGNDVVNPFDVHGPDLSWEDCLKADLRELVTCDAIYLQRGWEKSRGVRLELHVALELGLKVLTFDSTEWRRQYER